MLISCHKYYFSKLFVPKFMGKPQLNSVSLKISCNEFNPMNIKWISLKQQRWLSHLHLSPLLSASVTPTSRHRLLLSCKHLNHDQYCSSVVMTTIQRKLNCCTDTVCDSCCCDSCLVTSQCLSVLEDHLLISHQCPLSNQVSLISWTNLVKTTLIT